MQNYRGERITEAFRHLTGPSGGLLYHYSALRHRKALWLPFLASVKQWLANWKPRSPNLLLYGASAGWTLPSELFLRYQFIHIVEPDPLARVLLRRRFPQVKSWTFHDRVDLLPWLTRERELFARFLDENADADILFSNILGQIPLLLPALLTPTEHGQRRQGFFAALQNRNWASYHDLLSTQARLASLLTPKPKEGFEIGSVAAEAFRAGASVTDHETAWLSTGRETHFAFWQIRPDQWHLTAFVKGSLD